MNSKQIKLIREYPVLSGEKRREALDELLSCSGMEEDAFSLIPGEDMRAALRFLADASRRKKSCIILKPLVIKSVDMLLSLEDDKARKVAGILVGQCAVKECADKLFKALRSEKIRFVRPSLILALGNTDDPGKYLGGYVIEPGEEKHTREESSALKKALAKSVPQPQNVHFKLPQTAAVTFIKKSALITELEDNKIKYKLRGERLIEVPSASLSGLRCYDEALYYLGNMKDVKTAVKALDAMGCRGLFYRIEAGKFPPKQRQEIIKRISSSLADYGYDNNPSAYSFEIRVLRNGSLFAVLPQKERFPYRVSTISASINPVTAASVMQVCRQYLKNDSAVLDPFCGSATMLIERALALPCSSLTGVDNSSVAVKAALANRKAAGLEISIIKKDILDFGQMKFDEVISNMPFGNRVSGHKENQLLYRKFIDKLDSLLNDDGTAMLYTQEKKLLRENVQRHGSFTILKEEIFDSGGLFPTLFIIKRRV